MDPLHTIHVGALLVSLYTGYATIDNDSNQKIFADVGIFGKSNSLFNNFIKPQQTHKMRLPSQGELFIDVKWGHLHKQWPFPRGSRSLLCEPLNTIESHSEKAQQWQRVDYAEQSVYRNGLHKHVIEDIVIPPTWRHERNYYEKYDAFTTTNGKKLTISFVKYPHMDDGGNIIVYYDAPHQAQIRETIPFRRINGAIYKIRYEKSRIVSKYRQLRTVSLNNTQ